MRKYFRHDDESQRTKEDLHTPGVGGIWQLEQKELLLLSREVLEDAILIIDEVDQFFDEKDSALVEKMMEADTAIGFTATMGARLGARYLMQRLGDRVVFHEFLPLSLIHI